MATTKTSRKRAVPANASTSRRRKAAPSFSSDPTAPKSRLLGLIKLMSKAGVSSLLVTDPLDVGYLTGFLGGDSFLLVVNGKSTIISDGRFGEELSGFRKRFNVHIRQNPMFDAVGEVVRAAGLKSLGVQAEHLTLARRRFLADRCKGVKLIEVGGLVARLRAVKDKPEIESLRQAIAIQEASLESALDTLSDLLKKKLPVSEAHFAAVLEMEMRLRGSPEPSFGTIAGSGANASLPHYRAGAALIKKNVPLLIDWGATFDGYHGDMTRVVCFGVWPRQLAEVYRVVLEAHLRSASALGPGVSGKSVDAVARRVITEAGYGEMFVHSLGHGVGLQIHEEPRLSHMGAEVELKPGMVVTIEPGIYLPGIGGVRLENDYLITERGAENLCELPLDLSWATRR